MDDEIVRYGAQAPVVTLVTALAEAVDLSETEYRRIYDELRHGRSLRAFATAIGTSVSFAWWGKYEGGAASLDRARKNELRRQKGLPDLPLSVQEATAVVHPDAAVYRVSGSCGQGADGQVNRVILVEAGVGDLDMRLNGSLHVEVAQGGHVTAITPAKRPDARGSVHLSRETFAEANAARLAAGLSWDELVRLVLERLRDAAA
ncbi:MAG: hypothetical protein MUC51_17475 [Anaerolineae bacterium]|nr:hypothetical protein [Anaerolineae bacterium]